MKVDCSGILDKDAELLQFSARNEVGNVGVGSACVIVSYAIQYVFTVLLPCGVINENYDDSALSAHLLSTAHSWLLRYCETCS